MESWGMIISGYGVVFGAVLLYALVVVRRGRRLAAELGLGTPDNEGDALAGDQHNPPWN